MIIVATDYLKGIERFCPRCENKKNIRNFYNIYGKGDTYLPLCRSCVGKVFQRAKDKFGNVAAAICIAASAQDVPSIAHAIDLTLKKLEVKSERNGFDVYYSTLIELGQIYDGAVDSDASFKDYVKIQAKNISPTEGEKEEESRVDYSTLVRTWGKFTNEDGEPDKEAYDFLEDLFNKYTDGLLTMDTAMEYTYRDLCIAHWQKRKADEARDISEVEKAKKQINNALSLLKLDKFQNNTLTDEEKHIEHLIWEIENTTPSECEDLEKYRDFSGFEKAFGSIMRCVRNLVAGSKDYPELTKDETG